MKTRKDDRRSQRTRQLLSQAFLSLILEKPYDELTVQDIVERANVGRSTFYAHYQDKDDLLATNFGEMLEALSASSNEAESNPIFPSLGLFRHIQSHYHLYQPLAWGRGADVVFRAAYNYLSTRVEKYIGTLPKEKQETSVPLLVLSNYLAGSLLAFLRWWLDNRMPFPAERMDEMFQQLVMPGMRATLGAET